MPSVIQLLRCFMRYVLLAIIWLSELLYFVAIAGVIFYTITGDIHFLLGLIIVGAALYYWHALGGTMTWRAAAIRNRLRAFKQLGM